jgi:hypothetical protein
MLLSLIFLWVTAHQANLTLRKSWNISAATMLLVKQCLLASNLCCLWRMTANLCLCCLVPLGPVDWAVGGDWEVKEDRCSLSCLLSALVNTVLALVLYPGSRSSFQKQQLSPIFCFTKIPRTSHILHSEIWPQSTRDSILPHKFWVQILRIVSQVSETSVHSE